MPFKTRSASRKQFAEANENRRRERQKELMQKNIAEAKLRHQTAAGTSANESAGALRLSESYAKESAFPKELSARLCIDKKNNTLIVPIAGIPVPVHISYVKSVSKSEEGDFSYLRLNLSIPTKQDDHAHLTPECCYFIKALTLKSADFLHFQEVYKGITDLKKEKSIREQEESERKGVVEQKRLIEQTVSKLHILEDVYIKPAFPGRKYPGVLQIHKNGVRYQSQVREGEHQIDITFENVKHLIFQSSESESQVIIHFRLLNPIIVGKKKTVDLQFYREVLDSAVDETSGRRKRVNFADEDEVAEEEEERRRKKAADKDFKDFCMRISDLGEGVPFEATRREKGFVGVTARQNVLLQPTQHALAFLSDMPFLVISWNDVEVAYLERVMFGLRNFDIVFIFKDHSKEAVHVSSVPMASLEAVKDLLKYAVTSNFSDCGVPYAESTVNFNWPNIMKTINEDPAGFYEMGGWLYLQPGNSNNSDSDSEEESEFEAEEDDEEEDEEDDEEEEYSESNGGDNSQATESEDAPDWSDLEEQAYNEDLKERK